MSERMTVNNKKKGNKKHGFLGRLKTLGGKRVIQRRRKKGRKNI
jgi:ribosomal protein L34